MPNDRPSDWLSLEEISRYYARVRQELDERLAAASGSDSDPQTDPLLNVAIEHRLMHSEQLAYKFHRLPLERIAGGSSSQGLAATGPANDPTRMIEIPEGEITLGLRRNVSLFMGQRI